MSAHGAELAPRTAQHFGGTRSPGWWGMIGLISTEATLFATLLVSYFYLRFQSTPQWPPDGIARPTLELPMIMSFLLLGSSIPMHFAERGIRKGHVAALKAGLLVAFVMAAAFLGLMGVEYVEKLAEVTPRTNAYGSIFYATTGFHGTHVFVGVVMNLWLQVRAWMGHFDEERHGHVQNVTLYWHFVDAVWVFIFVSLYLSPNL
ncbi:MAG: cytochrome c oxidase subunit 3 [Actinomycetota bacterium]|nr:cytochrome c oxidase subunit 3 [Actinomycetota bacterium]